VALNTAQAATTSLQAPIYTLYVEP
jgi:hypothetical protein